MTQTNTKLTTAVEIYFSDLRRVRASGGATGERSSYPALANLLNAVGATVKPRVFCVSELADQGAGHPDFGLYAAKQVQRERAKEGQTPERGVVEVKAAGDDAWLTAESGQVSRYWNRYRQVLVTNTRDFVLVGEDASGRPAKLENFPVGRRCGSVRAHVADAARPRPRPGRRTGASISAGRCCTARRLPNRKIWPGCSPLTRVDGLARVEAAGDAPQLAAVRAALEEALGVRFEGEKGAHFFRSTLVQDAVLRRLFRLGAVGAAHAAAGGQVRLAHGGLASARAGARSLVSAAFPAPVACNRLVSSRFWTGRPPRSTG